LLAIAVLPAAAGLSDAVVGGQAFAAGHTQALRIAAGLAAVAAILAAVMLRPGRPTAANEPTSRSSPGSLG
jgi:hypothetical protein